MHKILVSLTALASVGGSLLAAAPAADAATRTAPTAPRAVAGYVGHPQASPKLDTRCLGKRGPLICINQSANRLYFLRDGKVVDDFSVRTGRAGMRTRTGVFRVEWKDRNSWSNLYHVTMPFSLYFSGGQAVHYSADFAATGYGVGSHGCANLRDYAGARMIFNNSPVGTPVVSYR